MAGKIKCTYDDCFRHFSSVEAMKKHKAKDSAHDFYCKKCDFDCDDDHELLLHQITSPKHIACPVCGKEFKSEAGRNRHVEIDHVPKQNIACVGCQMQFGRASALMAHIERDECTAIRRQDFQRHKAEQQIIQDAMAAALDPIAGTTILSNAGAFPTADNEMNLLDDERAYVNTDWQGRPQSDGEHEHNGPYSSPLSEQMSQLSINRFPPLGPQSRPAPPDRLPLITDPPTEAIEHVEPQLPDPTPLGVWGKSTKSASHLFKSTPSSLSNYNTKSLTGPTTTATSIDLLPSFDNDDLNTNDNTKPFHSSTASRSSSLAPQPSHRAPSTIPAASTAPNLDPNYPFAQVKTHRPVRPPTHISPSNYYDPVLNKYICPSQRCGQHFATHESFTAHITGPIHTSGPVSCPSCLKKFNTNTALMAHVESGSRKCRVRETMDFDRVVRHITAGIMAVEGVTEEGGVRFVAKNAEEW